MKRFLLWGIGLILLAVGAIAFELVRETRQHDPGHLMACMEVEKPLMSWVCEQVFFHGGFSEQDIADLNQTAGTRMVAVFSDPAKADAALVQLLREGVDINATDIRVQHMTALHAAALDGDVPQIRRLLAHGAKRDIRDDSGRTAADYARELQAKQPEQTHWKAIADMLAKG
ncbi:ankyrin repeat domain-containing protein [Nitrogeniibacter mangrovi]|uniref:Ankyrin repeat domain-containing protein n=1 Tax=Nitrogeniibacter mangrovi TaxID=2016596 RepID=A0A6C1B413_9RHOO|nr:ankyrin repeat domain-containing protein [Nitrogeniibacter mangrovi]QID17585.1 ankyrin repeat domain-containing protein [Nitrogeniibacter mangrovi]